MTWWWLSFADPDRPEGTRNLGVSIVRARDFVHAVEVAHARDCNPGGEVVGWPLDKDVMPTIPGTYRHRLLNDTQLALLRKRAQATASE